MPATASIDPAARWAARQIGELVHAQQTLASTPTRDNLINAISQIIEEMDNGQSALFARRIGVAKSTVHNWLKGDGTPTLKASLKIAAHSGASLTQLLSGDLSTWVCPQVEPQLV
jgi:DNA-binding XRE family transcriptional regulator